MNTPDRIIQLSQNPNLHPHGQHHPTSVYVERYWLPIIGPSCLMILRATQDLVDRYPNPLGPYIEMEAQELGHHFGTRSARRFLGKLTRLQDFGLANEVAPDMWFIASRIPNLTTKQAQTLPPAMANDHAHH